MRFARGDMRDHIASHQNDQGVSYRRYGVLQWPRRLKINFCEISDVVRFSTLQQYHINYGHRRNARASLFRAKSDLGPVSLDDFVGGNEQFRRHGEAERFRRLEVDGQIELAGLIHW
jgi:hypothetical protein